MFNSKKVKMMKKANAELLTVLSKMVVCFRDNDLAEHYNRIELQLAQLEESMEPCDYTYFKQLCTQFDDKLVSIVREKSDMAKKMMSPELLQHLGLTPNQASELANRPEEGRRKIGF